MRENVSHFSMCLRIDCQILMRNRGKTKLKNKGTADGSQRN